MKKSIIFVALITCLLTTGCISSADSQQEEDVPSFGGLEAYQYNQDREELSLSFYDGEDTPTSIINGYTHNCGSKDIHIFKHSIDDGYLDTDKTYTYNIDNETVDYIKIRLRYNRKETDIRGIYTDSFNRC
jgi:hypothetical protein